MQNNYMLPTFKPCGLVTIIHSIWHAGYSEKSNPFTRCYYKGDAEACKCLKQFGRTREEQARTYYLWAQTVPQPMWRYFSLYNLTEFTKAVADMVPPLAIANLLRVKDWYHYFKDATVADLFSGVCGWLMAFFFMPNHYTPRRWTAYDIDARRLQMCQFVGRELGVDVVAIRRDLSAPVRLHGVDVVVGSPPCQEFSAAKTTAPRRVDRGLQLVRSFLESTATSKPHFAVMEEAPTAKDAYNAVVQLASNYGFSYALIPLRDYGAIQHRRLRLIAWKERQE